ncbi:hypothetical protein N5C66_22475 [Rhizobium pusense]|nr:hypothetical protein [Agrobacterium pusense]MDH0910488.1 hypothetical protein [Agrobacterium pusense]MDH1098345.1 hypothetical protein [Agrobacterium pusense]MDH1114507.1 hypothetical protein [Agrobacterium pusense]MDH2195729.1 hypothetical protein [Agrobacterium pusense]
MEANLINDADDVADLMRASSMRRVTYPQCESTFAGFAALWLA